MAWQEALVTVAREALATAFFDGQAAAITVLRSAFTARVQTSGVYNADEALSEVAILAHVPAVRATAAAAAVTFFFAAYPLAPRRRRRHLDFSSQTSATTTRRGTRRRRMRWEWWRRGCRSGPPRRRPTSHRWHSRRCC